MNITIAAFVYVLTASLFAGLESIDIRHQDVNRLDIDSSNGRDKRFDLCLPGTNCDTKFAGAEAEAREFLRPGGNNPGR